MNHNSFGVEEHGFSMELNSFADLTEKEFKSRLGYKKPTHKTHKQTVSLSADNLPSSVNWLADKKVNPPKN